MPKKVRIKFVSKNPIEHAHCLLLVLFLPKRWSRNPRAGARTTSSEIATTNESRPSSGGSMGRP